MLIETIRLRGRLDPEAPAFTADVEHLLEEMRAAPGLQGQAFGFDAAAGEFLFVNIWKATEAADLRHSGAFIGAIERQTGEAPRVERMPLISWVSPPLETLVREVLQQAPKTP